MMKMKTGTKQQQNMGEEEMDSLQTVELMNKARKRGSEKKQNKMYCPLRAKISTISTIFKSSC